ncbi:MAG: retropepsin-like aspartic protease [bacterium]|nr:retropepsin-like aspartic protease [bacterium]
MKSLHVFPYGVRFRENGRIEAFPAVELSICGSGTMCLRAIFYIDSGATTTVIPSGDAAALGLDLSDSERIMVRGIGDETLMGHRCYIKFKIDNLLFKAPAIVMDNPAIPRILGREGIFPRFGVVFDESKHRSAFIEVKRGSKVIDGLFLG